jgi:hypothetical protein
LFIIDIYAIKYVIPIRESEHNAGRSGFIRTVKKIRGFGRVRVTHLVVNFKVGPNVPWFGPESVSKISIRAEFYFYGVQYACSSLEILIELKLTVGRSLILKDLIAVVIIL